MRLLEFFALDVPPPDFTGARGGQWASLSISGRGDDFPYDEDDPDHTYGQPTGYDRGSGNHGPSHRGITPEAIGTPTFFGKDAQVGSATGVPGASGYWASNPPRPWDEDDDATPGDKSSKSSKKALLSI